MKTKFPKPLIANLLKSFSRLLTFNEHKIQAFCENVKEIRNILSTLKS